MQNIVVFTGSEKNEHDLIVSMRRPTQWKRTKELRPVAQEIQGNVDEVRGMNGPAHIVLAGEYDCGERAGGMRFGGGRSVRSVGLLLPLPLSRTCVVLANP